MAGRVLGSGLRNGNEWPGSSCAPSETTCNLIILSDLLVKSGSLFRRWSASCVSRHGTEASVPTYTPDPSSLRRFLKTEVADWYRRERVQLVNRRAVRDQAF